MGRSAIHTLTLIQAHAQTQKAQKRESEYESERAKVFVCPALFQHLFSLLCVALCSFFCSLAVSHLALVCVLVCENACAV